MIWPLLAPLWFADAVVLGHKCCAHGCLAVATWRSYWPGRDPLVQCEHHRTWSARVAAELGVGLVSVRLPIQREADEIDDLTYSRRFGTGVE